ncbi:MAG: response regulator [Spirochaetales bacterium]|nr:response regulator [Spirochaetales bacterium]
MGVCIVDDSVISRDVVKMAMGMAGLEISIEAEDGVDALEKIKSSKGKSELYILDINMPRMDGLTLLKELRKLDAEAPVIMLTTETDKSKMAQAKTDGATGWVVKPFDTEKLLKIVNMVLKR